MLIDHLGLYIFNNFWVFRLIGRLAFPIFAYLIAEGLKHTHSRKKYILSLLIFALISQIPFCLLGKFYRLNVLFTYLLSILIVFLIEHRKRLKLFFIPVLTFVLLVLLVCEQFSIINYGIFGVLFPVAVYFSRDKIEKFFWALLLLLTYSLIGAVRGGFTPFSFIQFFSVLSLLIIYFYNGKNGKLKLKWLMYSFYPLHLLIIYFITLLIF